jgi:hypothetical protein
MLCRGLFSNGTKVEEIVQMCKWDGLMVLWLFGFVLSELIELTMLIMLTASGSPKGFNMNSKRNDTRNQAKYLENKWRN